MIKWKKKGCIYKLKSSNSWSTSHASVPCAIHLPEFNRIRIFFSCRDARNRSYPCYIDVNDYSFDLVQDIQTEPLFKLGELGAFDDCGVMPTWLMPVNNGYYLYYIGWSISTVPYQNAIGIAWSNDLKNFNKLFEGPVIGRSTIDPYFVASIAVLKQCDERYIGWYLSCKKWINIDDAYEPIYDLKIAHSTNAIDWYPENNVAIPLKPKEGGVSRPTVLFDDEVYKMWYSYRGFMNYRSNIDKSYRIGYAESHDGIHWDRKDNLCGIDISSSGWDSEMIEYPNVIKINEKLVMFYNGNGFGRSGIGVAVSDLS